MELMAYFFQWLYWRSADPETDALAGRRAVAPSLDLLTALGGLRQRLRETVGDELLVQHGDGWFDALESFRFQNLPEPRRRVRGKRGSRT